MAIKDFFKKVTRFGYIRDIETKEKKFGKFLWILYWIILGLVLLTIIIDGTEEAMGMLVYPILVVAGFPVAWAFDGIGYPDGERITSFPFYFIVLVIAVGWAGLMLYQVIFFSG